MNIWFESFFTFTHYGTGPNLNVGDSFHPAYVHQHLENHFTWILSCVRKLALLQLESVILAQKLNLPEDSFFIIAKAYLSCTSSESWLEGCLSFLRNWTRKKTCKSYLCLQNTNIYMRHWQLIWSKLGFYFSSGITSDIDVIFLWRTSYWSIEYKT